MKEEIRIAMKQETGNPKYALYIRLLTANQKRIYGFIYAMMPHQSVADDIMQETSLFMWEHFDDFRQGTNFSAWGISIARNLVMQYYRKNKRNFITFDSQAIENLIDQSDVFESQNDQIEALRRCFKKLQLKDQSILKMRYVQGNHVHEIAEKVNRTTSHLYRVLARIHCTLLKCIKLQQTF
jgi:RNA polymerase sigma-70 factor (ECF subfamily)